MAARWQQWMPFHIDAFKSSPGVRAMHPAARSGYLYLLAYAWQTDDCTIPSDPIELAEISELGDDLWQTYGPRILRKFTALEATGKLQNEKLLEEWKDAKRVFDQRSIGGKRNSHSAVIKDSSKTLPTVKDVTPPQEQEQEQKKEGLKPSSAEPTIRPQEFANAWNRERGQLPKVQEFTEDRRKKVMARIRGGITLERFTEAVTCCRGKPFLRGDNNRGWVATFDWLIANGTNVQKAIEQPYGGSDGIGEQGKKRTEGNAGTEGGEDGPDLYAALYGAVEQGKLN